MSHIVQKAAGPVSLGKFNVMVLSAECGYNFIYTHYQFSCPALIMFMLQRLWKFGWGAHYAFCNSVNLQHGDFCYVSLDETDIVSGSGTIFRVPVSVSIQCQNGQLILKMVKCRILGVTHIPVTDKTHFNLILSAFMILIFNKAINF